MILGIRDLSRDVVSSGICFLSIFLIFTSSQNFIIFDQVYSSPIESGSQTTRLSGPIVSLQFSSDGTPTWIVSGRWRLDVNYDTASAMPLSINNLNVSLVMVSTDGSITERFKISDLKATGLSYDNGTNILILNGTLKMIRGGQSIDNVGVTLKLINREVIIISLDPSKTKGYFGDTPIYGIER